MKLARFSYEGRTSIGKVLGDGIVDLEPVIPGVNGSMRTLLTKLPELRAAIEAHSGTAIPLSAVKLEVPVNDPQKCLAIGLNYEKHAQEGEQMGIPRPAVQSWFAKCVSALNGPFDPINLPRVSEQLDYECELAYVIGKRCKHVRAEEARDVIAGYMVANDVSVRDWQLRSPTTMIGKSFDTHAPMGPWLTLADEVPDAENLGIRTYVNGEERQNSNTNDLIYGIGAQIEHLTAVMTLEPGDIILTGTPSGVGIVLGKWLKAGDVVRIEIDTLGHIENVVRAEP